jgi:hypothetical protein
MKIKFFILFLSFFSLSSCDPYIYNIVIDDNGFEKEINFKCGKIGISCAIIGDRQIYIHQKFKLNYPVFINTEEFKISYKGEPVQANISSDGNIIKDTKEINNETQISIMINHVVVQNGDTLKINIDNFIVCREKPVEIGDINLIFVRRK